MKKIYFIVFILTLLFISSDKAISAETFENQDRIRIETKPAISQEAEKPKRKKFFSILERNKEEAKNEKTETIQTNAAENTQENIADDDGGTTNVLVDSDVIEYFPERYEFEAIGNAKVTFPEQDSILTADKIIFNHDTNYIKAYGNIVLTKDREKVYGDYMQINLNDENALVTEPVMKHMNIKIQAKTANINKVKTEAMEGTAVFTDKTQYKFASRSVFGFENPPINDEDSKFYLIKEKYNNEWNLKAEVIIVDSFKDHDVITMKNTDVYLKDLKVGRAGSLKIYTDKEQNFIETNIIELGSMRNLGAFISPGYVFPLPGGSTLKVGPAAGYSHEFGFGAIAKFQNANNQTDFGYLTSKGKMVMRGRQEFTDNLYAEYGINSYLSEWFMGGRMPKYGVMLTHATPVYNEDLKLNFESRLSGGIAQDWDSSFSTLRFRWQTQTMKDVYEYKNSDKKLAVALGLGVQSTASVYGTGDTYGMLRAGPYLRTQYKGWQQYAAYYLGAEAGDTPFYFDQFFYGRSNIVLGESLRINKYLTLMYAASLALADTPDDRFLQENRFYIVIGPDDFKVMLGYDAYRKNTTFGFNMAVSSDNSELEFKRLILNEPTELGKSDKKNKRNNIKNVNDQNSNIMDKSIKEYNEYDPAYNMIRNMIQPAGIRPLQ